MIKYTKSFHEKRNSNPVYLEMAVEVNSLIEKFQLKSVLDIGCSTGRMLSLIHIKSKTGIDYDSKQYRMYNAFHYISHNFNRSDISLLDKFDLIICQEVIEHIEIENEDNIIKTIDYNSKKGTVLVFSGAVPNQRGKHHVNCRDVDYWIKKLSQIDFVHKKVYSNRYKKALTENGCFKNNTNIFIKKKD